MRNGKGGVEGSARTRLIKAPFTSRRRYFTTAALFHTTHSLAHISHISRISIHLAVSRRDAEDYRCYGGSDRRPRRARAVGVLVCGRLLEQRAAHLPVEIGRAHV